MTRAPLPEHGNHNFLRAGFGDSCAGYVSISSKSDLTWLTESASFYQVKISSLLALDAGHRTIGKSLVGLAIQRHPNQKAAGHIIPNDLNAANGLAARPLPHGLKAFFAESRVAQSDSFYVLHGAGRKLYRMHQLNVRAHHVAEPKQASEDRKVAYHQRKFVIIHLLGSRPVQWFKKDRRSRVDATVELVAIALG
jgi:hypothetical protein